MGERVELPAGHARSPAVEMVGLETAPLAQRRARCPSARLPASRPGRRGAHRAGPRGSSDSAGFVPEQLASVGAQGFERGRNVAYVVVAAGALDPVDGRARAGRAAPGAPGARARRERARWSASASCRSGRAKAWRGGGRGDARRGRRSLTGAGRRRGAVQGHADPVAAGQPGRSTSSSPRDAMAPAFQRLADWKTQRACRRWCARSRSSSSSTRTAPTTPSASAASSATPTRAGARSGSCWAATPTWSPRGSAYTTFYGGEYIATDLYYSCLDGNWNADGDSLYGEGRSQLPVGPGRLARPAARGLRRPRAGHHGSPRRELLVDKTLSTSRTRSATTWTASCSSPRCCSRRTGSRARRPRSTAPQLIDDDLLPILDTVPGMHSVAALRELHRRRASGRARCRETRAIVIDSLNRGYNIAIHVGHGYRNVDVRGRRRPHQRRRGGAHERQPADRTSTRSTAPRPRSTSRASPRRS